MKHAIIFLVGKFFGRFIDRYVAYRAMGCSWYVALFSIDVDPTLIQWRFVRQIWSGDNDPMFRAFFWSNGWKMEAEIVVNPPPALGYFVDVPGADAVAIQDDNGLRWFVPNTKARAKVEEMVQRGHDPAKAEALVQSWVDAEVRQALTYGKTWVLFGLRVYATHAGKRLGMASIDGLSGDMFPAPDQEFEKMARRMTAEATADAITRINRQLRSVAAIHAL